MAADLDAAAAVLAGLGVGTPTQPGAGELVLPATTGTTLVVRAAEALETAGIEVAELGLRRPTLDDVFLTLTGHAAEDADAAPTAKRGRR